MISEISVPYSDSYEFNILSGVLNREQILIIKDQIKPEYFEDPAQAKLLEFALDFYRNHKIVPTKEVLKDAFKTDLHDIRTEVYLLIERLGFIDDALFHHSVDKFLNNYKGKIIDGLRKRLVETPSRGVSTALKEITRSLNTIKSIETTTEKIYYSDSAEHNDDFISEVKNCVSEESGIPTSNPIINDLTGGMKPKKLWVVFSAPGECKSTQLVNWAYDCWSAGKTAFYCTVEMSEREIKQCLYSLHIYRKYEFILDSKKIFSGQSLTAEELSYLDKARDDFNKAPGRIIIFELPVRYSFSSLESRLIKEHDLRPVDALFIDYLLLLKPDEKRSQMHEAYEQMYKDAKQLANTFDNNRGLFVATANQVSREGKVRARKRGFYLPEDFAKTQEVHNTPDFLLSNWLSDEMRANNELKQRVHKNRGGVLPTEPWICPIELSVSAINPPLTFSDDIPDNLRLE